MFYYRGWKEWDSEKGYLTDTCLTAQDRYKAYLDYFRIAYQVLIEKSMAGQKRSKEAARRESILRLHTAKNPPI